MSTMMVLWNTGLKENNCMKLNYLTNGRLNYFLGMIALVMISTINVTVISIANANTRIQTKSSISKIWR